MSYYCHPLNENYELPCSTYEGHGASAIDFSCPEGTNVYSMSDGVVDTIYRNSSTAGNAIVIKLQNSNWNKSHSDNAYFRYLHLSQILVKEGQQVKVGEKIGLSGNTGQSTGPHLHVDLLYGADGSNGPVLLYLNEFNNKAQKRYFVPPATYDGTPTYVQTEPDPPTYMKAIFGQEIQPIYASTNVDGGITLKPNADTPSDSEFQTAYFNKQFTADFMGVAPETLESNGDPITEEDLKNCPSIWFAYFGLHEFNTGASGENDADWGENSAMYNCSLMVGKLFRFSAIQSNWSKLNRVITDSGAESQIIGESGASFKKDIKDKYCKTARFLKFC